jgi:hypothetical protein
MNRLCDESTRDESTRDKSHQDKSARDESVHDEVVPALNRPVMNLPYDESTLRWIDPQGIEPRWIEFAMNRAVMNLIAMNLPAMNRSAMSRPQGPSIIKKMTILVFVYFGTHNNKIHTIYKEASVFVFLLLAKQKKRQFRYDLSMLCLGLGRLMMNRPTMNPLCNESTRRWIDPLWIAPRWIDPQ